MVDLSGTHNMHSPQAQREICTPSLCLTNWSRCIQWYYSGFSTVSTHVRLFPGGERACTFPFWNVAAFLFPSLLSRSLRLATWSWLSGCMGLWKTTHPGESLHLSPAWRLFGPKSLAWRGIYWKLQPSKRVYLTLTSHWTVPRKCAYYNLIFEPQLLHSHFEYLFDVLTKQCYLLSPI